VPHNFNTNFYRFIYIHKILYSCSDDWLTGHNKCSEMYSWYTERATKLLRFLREIWGRGARWEFFHLISF
jgi:hypothetical protein